MRPVPRRRFLQTGWLVAALAAGGCLGGFPAGRASDHDDYAIVQYSTALGQPEWREDGRTGYLDAFGSETAVRESLDIEALPGDRREDVGSFVAATDFEAEILLYVASTGPDTCHDGIRVRELGTDGSTLTGEMAVIDTSDGAVDCGAAETHPSALIRPAFDRPERVAITVVDGRGDRETLRRKL